MKFSLLKFAAVLVAAAVFALPANAASISLDFGRDGNDVLAGGETVGPFGSNSSDWNQGTAAIGTITGLNSDSGATTAAVTWVSSNTWSDGNTSDDNHKIGRGYLDDGGPGVLATFTDIPYSSYTVTLLFGSDQGGGPEYETVDFNVGGSLLFGATAPAYNNVDDAMAGAGALWVDMAGGATRGNYATSGVLSGSTLVIDGDARAGDNRGSLSGVIITSTVPEPSTFLLLGIASVFGLVITRRRK